MKWPVAFVLLAVVAIGSGARAQVDSREGIALQNQIAELRQEIQQMQQASQGAGPAPQPYASPQQYAPQGPDNGGGGDTAASLLVRVSALEEQNRQLQGRVDDLTNQLQRQHDELAKQIGDLSFKLGQGGSPEPAGQPSLAPPSPQPGPAQQAAPPAPARRTPEMALRAGNTALTRHDYAAAAAAAREALGGRGATAISAQFLLARAEGGQRDYKSAAADYYQAYNHAPRAGTAPVALLGVANSLIALNDRADACQALAKLQAEFPGAASVKAGAASARKRAACGK